MAVNGAISEPCLWVGVASGVDKPATCWSALAADAATRHAIDALFEQPNLHFVRYDAARDACLFVPLERDAYQRASFLDLARVEPFARERALLIGVPRQRLFACRLPALQTAHFVLHTSHCGSTLLSRALAAVSASLPVREPPALNWAAESLRSGSQAFDKTRQLAWCAALVARRYVASEPAVVKLASSASNLGPALLRRDRTARAVALYQSLPEHVVALMPYRVRAVPLAAAEAEADLGLEPARCLAEQLAVGWLGRVWSMHRLACEFGPRVCFASKAALLAAPEASVRRVSAHLGLSWRESAPGLSEVWARDAKAPAERYPHAQRAQAEASALTMYAREIAQAERCIDTICRTRPELQAALERLG